MVGNRIGYNDDYDGVTDISTIEIQTTTAVSSSLQLDCSFYRM